MYRDKFKACPACDGRLEEARSTWRCPNCTGLWIEERVFVQMVSYEGMALDRCADHGIWFDEPELQRVLQSAAENRPSLGFFEYTVYDLLS